MSKKVVITGGCGFIGHHLVEHLVINSDWDLVVLDRLSYASAGFERLRDTGTLSNPRVKVFTCDLTKKMEKGLELEIGDPDYIIHLASESHVDNSIANPVDFIHNNIDCTLYLLEWSRTLKNLKKFILFSTDEVYGTAPESIDYAEDARFNPGNPYSASKASQECIAMAYANTYRLPIIITHAMNVIGERQHQEKFVPMAIKKNLVNELVHIHADSSKTKAGKRNYIHARNVAAALLFIINNLNEFVDNIDASLGKYNIVGEKEYDNLSLALLIADLMGTHLNYEMIDFHSSRPGHDLRYSLDGSKLFDLGFSYPKTFEDSLKKTIEWTVNNPKWLNL